MFRIKTMLAALLAALLLFSLSFAEEPQSLWTDLGTGSGQMTVIVVLPDLTTKGYRIHSDKATMLEALLELELVTVLEGETGPVLTMVDGCALPEDQPDAYWFLSVYDVTLDSLVPVTTAIDQLPLAGQTYAIGMINAGTAQ
jgi:hypothetical protein